MRVVRDDGVQGGRESDGAVVTIGAYDGVHRGHQAVLELVSQLARARNLDAVMATFDRHPASVVRPDQAPKLLTTMDQKVEVLDALNLLDLCLVLRFDEARAKETAEEFVVEVLVERLRARVVVVGADFHFGHRRAGSVAMLESMGNDLGFEVIGLGLVAPDGGGGVPYSSTRVRTALAGGEVAQANEILGRAYALRGTVVTGDQRGRELGFPTANVAMGSEMCVPADGVYAGRLVDHTDGVVRDAAISVGTRPTFYDDGQQLVEVFVLDFDGDLYGHEVDVEFVGHVRGQARFDGVDALIAQMHQDVQTVRTLLAR